MNRGKADVSSSINFLFLYAPFFTCLLLLPLQNTVLSALLQSGRTWNWSGILLFSTLAYYYVIRPRETKLEMNQLSVQRTALVSAVFLALSFITATYQPSFYQLTLYILVILSAPIVIALVKNHFSLALVTTLAVLSLHAQWGIAQFIFQRDLGLQILGESTLSPTTPAVAKFSANDTKIIRAYGPYAHSNDYAGALLIGLLTTYIFLHTIPSHKRAEYWPFLRAIISILLLGLFTSFTRSALLGLFILFLIALRQHVLTPQHRIRYVSWVILGIISAVFVPLLLLRSFDPDSQALMERVRGYSWATEIIRANAPFYGVGVGQYTTSLRGYLEVNTIFYNPWEVAPVHSGPLLLLAEFGFTAGIFIILILFTYIPFLSSVLFLPLVPPLLLDHYFVTNVSPLLWLMLLAILYKHSQILRTFR